MSNFLKQHKLALKLAAFTFFPPMWAAYVVVGVIATFFLFIVGDVVLFGVNLGIIWPQHILVDMLNSLLQTHYAPWTKVSYLPVVDMNATPDNLFTIKQSPLFGPTSLSVAILTYITHMTRTIKAALKSGELKLPTFKKQQKPQ